MEQRASDAGGDGDQVALPSEDFDLAGAGEFGEVDGTSGANAVDGGIVGGDREKHKASSASGVLTGPRHCQLRGRGRPAPHGAR